MLTQKQIEGALDEAEQSFKDCWLKLLTIRRCVDIKAEVFVAVITFQPTLGNTLYFLEMLYKEVCEEERDLISRKSGLNQKWFGYRLHILSGYRKLITKAMDVGKVMGDSFAWIFYRNEHELLRNHANHEANPHLPTGIGGRGEIHFIRGCPMFGDYFVLAHSITTFLRIGDVSLFDLSEGIVAGIGELKTRAVGDSELVVTINLVGPKLNKSRLPKTASDQTTQHSYQPLPPQMLERLKRQIVGIQDALKPLVFNSGVAPVQMGADYLHSKVADLYRQTVRVAIGSIKADRGLLLVGIRLKGNTLYSRLTSKLSKKRVVDRLYNTQFIRRITDRSLKDYRPRFDWLPYPTNGRYSLLLGMRPLFWWPMEAEVIEALLFREFAVMTLYNPVFLIDDLRRGGIEIEAGINGELQIIKRMGDTELRAYGVPYVLKLIQTHLLSDSSAVALIYKFFEAIEKSDLQQPVAVTLDLRFEYAE